MSSTRIRLNYSRLVSTIFGAILHQQYAIPGLWNSVLKKSQGQKFQRSKQSCVFLFEKRNLVISQFGCRVFMVVDPLMINFNRKAMLSDYVLRNIDNLFSDKLDSRESIKLAKPARRLRVHGIFNKEAIRKQLPLIIRRENGASPPSVSPLTKSRLKIILENNKEERIRSVVKRSYQNEASPYRRIECGQRQEEEENGQDNSRIVFYRQQRKTTEKSRIEQSKSKEGRASRIFRRDSQTEKLTTSSSMKKL